MGLFDGIGKAVGGAVGAVAKPVGNIVGGALGGIFGGANESMGGQGGGGGFTIEDYKRLQEEREASMARLTAKAREEREKDLAAGRARGEEIFGKPFYQESRNERSQDVTDILARRKEALKGLSSQENEAARNLSQLAIKQQQDAQMRQLRGAQSQAGVRGGLATAQQAQVLNQAEQNRRATEQQLLLQDIALKQQALDSLEQSTRAAEGEEIDRYGRRQLGKLSTELGYGSLGAAERAGISAQLIGSAQAQAANQQAQAAAGGKK